MKLVTELHILIQLFLSENMKNSLDKYHTERTCY